MNQLYFGDNLDILKDLHRKHPEGYIDLIYIDPPFNSKRNYNVLFEDVDMLDTKAQKEAFADTWSNVSYYDTLEELKELDLDLYRFIEALDGIRISKSAIAYLTTMAVRIFFMHKLLKDTGSFYLHCDPVMSHYLKIVCDLIFGVKNFRNEIIWHYKRWTNVQKQFQHLHDVILFYSISEKNTFNLTEVDMSESQMKKFMRGWDSNVIYQGEERYSQLIVYNKEKFEKAKQLGKIKVEKYKNIIFRDKPRVPAPDVIIMPALNSQAKERLGYPTQKPMALLDLIINASTIEDDIIADFFCGCGTTIAAAEKLGRKWIGADISHLAIKLISKRLMDTHGPQIRDTFEIHGFPKDIASAKSLATDTKSGRFKFEEWIVEVMLHGVLNAVKTQTGYDGYFTLNVQGKKDVVLIEVKSGNATLTQLNHFIQTVESKKAQAGVFVCFSEQVTRGMTESAKKQGYYRQDVFGTRHDKIQIMTVEDLMDDKLVNLPRFEQTTFKAAKKETKEVGDQGKLFE